MTVASLSQGDFDRIATTVRRVEAMPQNIAGKHRRRHIGMSAGGAKLRRGKLDGSLSAGGHAVVSIWAVNASTATDADTGDNVTAYDWLLKTGKSFPAGTKVIVAWFADSRRWYVIAAGCA